MSLGSDLGHLRGARHRSVLLVIRGFICSQASSEGKGKGIQIIRIPCIRPTVHLICGHSLATVGLYAGETVCFVLSRNPSVYRPNINHSNSLVFCSKFVVDMGHGYPQGESMCPIRG